MCLSTCCWLMTDAAGRLKSCWAWCIKWCAASRNAALPPRCQQQLQQLSTRLDKAVEAAEKNGAFTYVQQLRRGLPLLYIPHEELCQEVTDKLRREAAAVCAPGMPAASGVRGVLITGSRGMGKSTLARDVALRLQAGEYEA